MRNKCFLKCIYNSFKSVLHSHFIVHTLLLLLLLLLLLKRRLRRLSSPLKRWVKMLETILFFEIELKMLEIVYCFWMVKSELIGSMYFETEYCRLLPRRFQLHGSDIFCVCVNFQKLIQSVMSSNSVSTACLLSAVRCLCLCLCCCHSAYFRCCCYCPCVNRTTHGKWSAVDIIIEIVHVGACAQLFGVEVKVNLIRCDIRCGAREWRRVPWRNWYRDMWGSI